MLAASCIRKPTPGMRVTTAMRRGPRSRASWSSSSCWPTSPARDRARSRLDASGAGPTGRRRGEPVPAARPHAGARPQPPGDGRPARRLHPVQPLRPRLPRGPGQRRDRHGGRGAMPRRSSSTSTTRWAEHLRRLRRVRPGLPDRRAHAGDGARRARGRCAYARPLRSTASAPTAASAASSPTRSRATSILYVDGATGPANHNRLCVKGRYGFDYVHHPRSADRPPRSARTACPSTPTTRSIRPIRGPTSARRPGTRRSTRAAAGLKRVRDAQGGAALAGFGSAKGSNEEAYLFQKLVRTGFGSNNVDHCTRLCHASSVAALMETIGSGAVTAPFRPPQDADVIIVIGANPTVNHPVAATFIKNAAKRRRDADRHGPARPGAEPPRDPHAAIPAGHATWRC